MVQMLKERLGFQSPLQIRMNLLHVHKVALALCLLMDEISTVYILFSFVSNINFNYLHALVFQMFQNLQTSFHFQKNKIFPFPFS